MYVLPSLIWYKYWVWVHFTLFPIFFNSVAINVVVFTEATTKSKLATLNEKLDTLERRLELLEVQVTTATANPALFNVWNDDASF